MIVPSKGCRQPGEPDILPGVQGKFTKVLTRSARHAVLLTTLSLVLALTIAVGGFVASSAVAPGYALAAAIPTPHATDISLAPTSISDTPWYMADTPRLSVAAVSDQAFEASREAVPTATPEPEPEPVVRAARLTAGPDPLVAGDRIVAPVSFYYCAVGGEPPARGDGGGFCGVMRDGSTVYNGAAACDYAYLGQRFRIEGDPLERIYRCADTGSAVHGLHRDVWFSSSDEGWAWQRIVGRTATIEILP